MKRLILFVVVLIASAGWFPAATEAALNCPNKPAGATNVADMQFNTPDGEGQLWEIYPGSGFISQPGGLTGSPPNASTSRLPAGQSIGGQQTIYPKPGSQQPLTNMYLCMGWKMSPGFVGLQTSNKLVFMTARDFTFGRAAMNGLFMVQPNGYGTGNYYMIFAHNSGQLDNSHACAADLGLICNPNVTTTTLNADTFYTVEAYLVASSCQTCRNSTVKWWINGVLNGNYTNLNYGDGILNQWEINHTWDGSLDKQCGPPTNPGNPIGRDCRIDQMHYFDHVILASVGGVGPGGGGGGTDTTPPSRVGNVTVTQLN